MKRIGSSLQCVAASLVFAVFSSLFPESAGATEIYAKDYRSIQDAISAATGSTSDIVVVDPGIYEGTIIMRNNVSLRGTETARTFLSGGGGPVVTADGQISATIQNFTFVKASSGILVRNNTSSLSIINNVFEVGTGGTAITIQNSPSIRVFNNTFFQNGTALTTDSNIEIFNNIFSNDTTAIVDPFSLSPNIANNVFSGNLDSGPTGTNSVVGDPLFVDPVNHDFHLREGSPCIDTGNASTGTDIIDGSASDIGAYGGPSADTIPFPVVGLSITSVTSAATDASISLNWSPNLSYLVTNTDPALRGTYVLYFGSAPGDYTCTVATCGVDSPIPMGTITGEPLNDATLNGLTFSTTTPSAPSTVQSSPRDSRLVLTWSAVPGATGYKVHYGISSPDENDPIDVGNVTSYELSGLTNEQKYFVAVSAYTWQKYYFAITARNHSATPTIHPESVYTTETSTQIGQTMYSGLSPVINDFPELVITYPALPDSGGRCFIATAAYGYYSAPEVQALRAFRDRYLLTSVSGRMFVQWYYQHGPAAAAFLNDHPGYKPLVRAALMPVVGTAIFMTGTSMMFKTIVFLVLGSAIAFGFFRRRLSGMGELR